MRRPRWEIEGADWPHRLSSRFVSVGGIDWHIQQMGQGPALLLLHGTGAASHSWRGMVPLLAQHFTLLIPDLSGHGFSSAPPRESGYRLPAVAHAVATLCDELTVEPVFILGHSAGAAVAIRMTLDGLAAPRALVSLNGALLPFPGPAAQLFPAMARLIFANPFTPRLFAMRAAMPGETARFLAASTGSVIDDEGAALYERLFQTAGHCAGALGLMANWDLESLQRDLSRLAPPLLLMSSGNDKAVPTSVATRVVQQVPGATTHHFPALGHLAHEEAPQAVADVVVQFLGRHAKPPG